jgi:DNA-binding NarL/FixJ family response regulator
MEQVPSSRVYVADAHGIARCGAIHCLEAGGFAVVGETGDGHVALHDIARLSPEVVVMAEELKSLSAIDLLGELPRDHRLRIVILCTKADPKRVRAALAAGAIGYVVAAEGCGQLREVVAGVAHGAPTLSPAVQRALVGEIHSTGSDSLPTLTRREREVLTLTADSLRAVEIARTMSLGLSTIRKHQQHVYEKLDAPTSAGAVGTALRLGLID